MGEQSALFDLIRRARYRHAFQLLLHQVMFASAVALGGFILLLLLGTQVLGALWLAVLFLASLALGLYRARAAFRSAYQLAQGIDHRLQLHDTLSTALYFNQHKTSRAPKDLIERQRQTAEDAAREANLNLGLPFVVPKSVYAGTGLAVLALTVFGVRYGVTKSMDLHASLVQIAFNGLLGPEDIAAIKKKGQEKPGADKSKESSLTVDPWESKALDQQGAPETALNTVDTPDVNNPEYKTEANAKADGMKSQDPVQQPANSDDNSDKNATGDQQSADNQDSNRESKSGKKDGEQQDRQGNNSGENSSLTDKMRDALSNLMSKLKMQSKPQSGQPNSSQSQQAQNKQGNQEKGSQQAGKPQADAMSSPDQQGQQEGESSDKAASAQNKSGKNSDRPPTQDGKSGVGKEDGDKSAREAEQLAAMGKISEIIGKRAANMSGEVMVEVSSGNQQLRTQYSQRKAAHSDAGGEIGRDEVPLVYQQFVQQYFDEIRKTPATGPQPPAPKAR